MDQDPKLVVILFLVAFAVLLQAAALVGILLSVLRVRREIEGIRADVKQRLEPASQYAAEIMAGARDPIRTITANLAEISRSLRDRTSQVDHLVADVVERARLQIVRIDQMVSDLVQKVESTADAVERQIMAPIRELSAVVKGVRSGLDFLLSRRRAAKVGEATQDEQMFI